ncbi:NADP oxidoreductase [Paraflavisolibacter sp. H34]|uniref:NADP oxidoreductase n=1 Tax=Huijunlia imazamoxiresistens TaxID=3127457 RepID=UPI0030173291
MQTKQTIALIGATAGKCPELAKNLAKGHYRLLLMDKDPEQLGRLLQAIKEAAQQADLEVIDCPREACWEADIIISTVPCCEEKQLAENIKQVATGKIIISLAATGGQEAAAAASALQQLLPYSKVVRTLTPVAEAGEALPGQQESNFLVAGKDEEALDTVIDLLQQCGLHLVIGTTTATSN